MKKIKRKIPGSIEWSGYKEDLDVRHTHKLFFGKPISEVQHVASHQGAYDADRNIYGSFEELAEKLHTLCVTG